ncbi:MAG: FAD-dependent oxidoreductase [Patescibacteria group bacterium]
MQQLKILIIGGGFGGIIAARELAKKKTGAQIKLVSNKNYFEYYPALYRIVTGASPIEVCVPLDEILPKSIEIDVDKIISIDLSLKKATSESGSIYTYDILIMALGSETTYFGLPGIQDFSLGFKSINEALRLKGHIANLFVEHEHPSTSEFVSHFHVVIVGGGPSGVEVAGDLSVHLKHLAKTHKVDPSFITIDLIESNPRLIPTLPEKVSKKILARLRSLGVNVYLNRFLMKEELEQVYMKDMSLQAKTVIWTAGTQINKIFSTIVGLTFAKNKRVEVDEYLQAKGFQDVYVIGDAAATEYSGLAQTAIYDGEYVAQVIARKLKNKKVQIYEPKKTAFAIPIGENWGVFSTGSFAIYGFFAYIIRHMIDFMFFSNILSCRKFLSLYFEGWKYRKDQ